MIKRLKIQSSDLLLLLLFSFFLVKNFYFDYLPKYSYITFKDNPSVITIIKDKEYFGETIYYICNERIKDLNQLSFVYSYAILKESKVGSYRFDFSWDKTNVSMFSAFGKVEFERNNYFFYTEEYDYKRFKNQRSVHLRYLKRRNFLD